MACCSTRPARKPAAATAARRASIRNGSILARGASGRCRSSLPSPQARLVANVQATGARGGHDLHFRVLRDLGVQLTGHMDKVSDGSVHFADDLAQSVAFGDARYEDMRRLVRDR